MAYTNNMRLLGLNSGWDTETMVTNLMKAESYRLNSLKKSAMLISLRQDLYRDVYSDLQNFQKSFLSVASASGSLRAESTFSNKIISTKTSAGQDSGAVTVGSGSKEGTYSITVHQLAVADLYESASRVGGDISSSKGFQFDVSSIQDGASYEIMLDGASRKISFREGDKVSGGTVTFSGGSIGVKALDGTVTTLDEQGFIDQFNEKLKNAFGMEGIGGKQKIEAKLTDTGGVSIFTNGYHSGFSISDGEYNFASTIAQNKTALADGKTATESRELAFSVKVGTATTNIDISVTEGMTQQQMIDALNGQLEAKGLGNHVFAHVDTSTGRLKIVNFSSTEQAEITGTDGSMEYLGFDGETVELLPSGSLGNLGITSGTASKFSADRTLSEIFGSGLTQEADFTINGKSFSFTGDTKLSDLMTQVNSANLGVTMRYDEYNQKFQLESNSTGYVGRIEMSGELLTDHLGFGATAKRDAADSVATINGTTITRSTNEYEFLGVDWKLNKAADGEQLTVTIGRDIDKTVDAIKNFIDGYNTLVEKLNGLSRTSRPKYNGSYYDPLTDEEKAEMTDKEIELWEEKAKTGLFYNDRILTGITNDLRSALNQSVTLGDGSKISLYSLGITTTNDWTKGGQLMIKDEQKLREAIETNSDGVMELFTKASDNGGKGLAERVNDVVNSAISTKGSIANKAGIAGTYTESNNELYRQLKAKNDKITLMLKQLETKETNYYNMFARMEAAMSQANSQMQYISSMFGGG